MSIPSPYQCEVRLSYGDYQIYNALEQNVSQNNCVKLDVFGRAMFMAGSKLPSFRPCNVVDFVVKAIGIVAKEDSFAWIMDDIYGVLKKGCCGIPYQRIKKDDDGNYLDEEESFARALKEAESVLKELYDWKKSNMI